MSKIPTHHTGTPIIESPVVLGDREDPTAWAKKVNIVQVAPKLYSLLYKLPCLRHTPQSAPVFPNLSTSDSNASKADYYFKGE